MALHFTKEEFQKRKLNVLKSMKEQNLDALLMFRQESMYWLTGYDTFGYVFFPKYLGLFVKPVGFESSFLVKLDFPL